MAESQMLDLIRQNPFASLVTPNGDQAQCSMLPLLLDEESSKLRLIGHLAAANPHVQSLAESPALAIFQGPHAYISPSWYETTKAVPTWNYIAVQVFGTSRLVEDPQQVEQTLLKHVAHFESEWRPEPEILTQLIPQIQMFTIEIERLEGASKLSQHHPPERRQRVIDELKQRADGDSRDLAQEMQKAGR